MAKEGKKEGMPRQGRRLLTAFFSMWIGFVAAWYFHQRPGSPPLYVVNGLPVAVTVTVGDQTVHLRPSTHDFLVEVPVGENEVVVKTDGGQTLSTETIELTRGRVMALYNVLGAAYVFHRKFWYGYGFEKEDQDYRLYVDDAFHDIAYERVQLIFEMPPERVSTKLGSSDVYLRFVGLPDSAWDWRATVEELRRMERTQQADSIEARVAKALPDLAAGG